MQTTGAALLGVQRCNLPYMRMTAHGSHSVDRLLYLAAIPGGSCQQEHCQGRVDVGWARDPPTVLKYQARTLTQKTTY
jgi:hypothetical protein